MKKFKIFLLVLEVPVGHTFIAFALIVGLVGFPLMGASQLIIDLLYLSGYVGAGIVSVISTYWNVSNYHKTGEINYGWFGDPDQTSPY